VLERGGVDVDVGVCGEERATGQGGEVNCGGGAGEGQEGDRAAAASADHGAGRQELDGDVRVRGEEAGLVAEDGGIAGAEGGFADDGGRRGAVVVAEDGVLAGEGEFGALAAIFGRQGGVSGGEDVCVAAGLEEAGSGGRRSRSQFRPGRPVRGPGARGRAR
jgi:hypothetical protein